MGTSAVNHGMSSLKTALLWLGLIVSGSAEPKNLLLPGGNQYSAPIQVPAGAVLELLCIHSQEVPGSLDVKINSGGTELTSRLQPISATNGYSSNKLVGPVTVMFRGASGATTTLVSYSITDSSAELKSPALAIPDDGSGNYEVSLESTSDLVNWTAVAPGVYPSTTARRFFRVSVKKPSP